MDYWQTQKDKPLFQDVIWSRPETKHGAGKLAIIGGSAGAMSLVSSAYSSAEHAGVGTIHLLVPDSLAKVTKGIPHIQHAPSNPSGGFAKTALSELLSLSEVVDGVLLAGDMGKNSETSQMLEIYLEKYDGMLGLGGNSLESFSITFREILQRKNTLIYLSLNQLRSIAIDLKLEIPVTSDIGRSQIAKLLHGITIENNATIIFKHASVVWIAESGKVADCIANDFSEAKSVIWAIQQPEKLFESLVSSVIN